MARLKVTHDNMLVEADSTGSHMAALKQSYDGGWSISSHPEPLSPNLPNATFSTRDELIETLDVTGDVARWGRPVPRRFPHRVPFAMGGDHPARMADQRPEHWREGDTQVPDPAFLTRVPRAAMLSPPPET